MLIGKRRGTTAVHGQRSEYVTLGPMDASLTVCVGGGASCGAPFCKTTPPPATGWCGMPPHPPPSIKCKACSRYHLSGPWGHFAPDVRTASHAANTAAKAKQWWDEVDCCVLCCQKHRGAGGALMPGRRGIPCTEGPAHCQCRELRSRIDPCALVPPTPEKSTE